MYYIEEADKPNRILKTLRIIKLQGNKIILPISKEDLTNTYQQKLAIKTNKILKKTNSNKIVLSKKIKQYETYVNYLYSYNIEIVDGKWLFKIMVPDILDYIIEKQELKKEELEVSVLVNYIGDIEIENIKLLAKEYKIVNIVTNHIEKLRKITNKLYEEYGIMITVNNNKKKSLRKSKIIVNFDFPKELLNKYNIFDDAIIINVNGNMKIDKKRFNGLNINDFEINKISDEKYSSKEVYEAKFFKRQNCKYIRKKIQKDNVQIKELIGNNGILM